MFDRGELFDLYTILLDMAESQKELADKYGLKYHKDNYEKAVALKDKAWQLIYENSPANADT